MKKLPDWFEGEIYEIGDEVRNPFSGETCLLNANELSMYDLIKGAEMMMMMGIVVDSDECARIMVDGSEWFKKNNPKAYKALLD